MEVGNGDAGRLKISAINITNLQGGENLNSACVFGIRQTCTVRSNDWGVVDGLNGQRERTGCAVEAWVNCVDYCIADLDVSIAVKVWQDF